jgi:hypothetical protein
LDNTQIYDIWYVVYQSQDIITYLRSSCKSIMISDFE